MNILWGKLCQKKLTKHLITNKSDILILDERLENITPYSNGNIRICTKSLNQQYKTGWARIAPFLLSKGREKIAKIIDSFGNDNIVRCHTDGIISKIESNENITLGLSLGNLKFEEHTDTSTAPFVIH